MLHDIDDPISIFAGRSNPELAEKIAQRLRLPLGEVTLTNFSDEEIYVSFEESIRGHDVYIVQSTSPPADNWMELFLMIDAARRASAKRITAVMPYFGYGRQERKDKPRVAIAAKLMANMLTTAGADRVLTMDLHAPQIQGFFDIPVDHLYGSSVLVQELQWRQLPDLVIVAPDFGSVKRARAYAERLNAGIAIIDKRRPKQNVSEVMNIIGEVKDKNCVLLDDMIDTAGTLCSAAQALRDAGALYVMAACTHPILSGKALERLAESEISELIVTDTIPLKRSLDKIKVVSVADAFADAISRIYADTSISGMFDY